MTTRPRSSIRLTIPVAFICKFLLVYCGLVNFNRYYLQLLSEYACFYRELSIRLNCPAKKLFTGESTSAGKKLFLFQNILLSNRRKPFFQIGQKIVNMLGANRQADGVLSNTLTGQLFVGELGMGCRRRVNDQ